MVGFVYLLRYLFLVFIVGCWVVVYGQDRVVSLRNIRDSLVKTQIQELDKSVLRDTASLNDVVIYGTKKSKISQDAMKLSFTPNTALKAGSSIVDLFKSTPMLAFNEVGEEGTPEVRIIGKSSTSIFINGKPTFMPMETIMSLLSAQNAQDVERIEVITNPKPSPDIPQGGGVINIVLKKNLQKGWSGSLRLNGGQNNRTFGNFGASLAYQHPKFDFSIGSFVGSRARVAENIIENTFLNTGVLQQSKSEIPSRSLASGALVTLVYKPSKQHNFTVGLGGFGMYRTRQENNQNAFFRSANEPAYENYMVENLRNRSLFAGRLSVDYEYRPDNQGSSLQLKTMVTYFSASPTTNLNTFKEGDTTKVVQLNNIASLNYRLMLTYNHVFNKVHSLESGLSFMHTQTDNRFESRVQKREQQNLTNLNIKYNYATPTYMAYISHVANWSKYWQTLVSLSMQYYQQEGITKYNQQSSDLFSKNYWFLLPNIAISYQPNQEHLFSLSLMRISQPPSFMDVNPFVIQQGNNTYTQGNAELLVPSNYESSLTYTLKQAYTFALRYSFTNDAYTKIQTLGRSQNNSILTMPFNYGSLHGAYAGLSVSKRFFRAYWQFQSNFVLQYTYYNGEIPLFRLQNGGFGGELSLNNTVSLTNPIKNNNPWLANLEFRYNLPSFLLYGLNSVGPNLILGIKKKYKQWSFGLSVHDVFRSSYYVVKTFMPGVLQTNTMTYKDTRAVRLSVNFSFGGNTGFNRGNGGRQNKFNGAKSIEKVQKEQPSVIDDSGTGNNMEGMH